MEEEITKMRAPIPIGGGLCGPARSLAVAIRYALPIGRWFSRVCRTKKAGGKPWETMAGKLADKFKANMPKKIYRTES